MKKIFKFGMSLLSASALGICAFMSKPFARTDASEKNAVEVFEEKQTLAQLAFGYSGDGTNELPYSINQDDSKNLMAIRFGCVLPIAEYDALVDFAASENLSFGVHYSIDGEFDDNNDFDKDIEGAFVINQQDTIAVEKVNANYFQFALAFKHIPTANFDDPIIATCYVKIGETKYSMGNKKVCVNSLAARYVELYDGGSGDTSFAEHIGVLDWLSHQCNVTGVHVPASSISSKLDGNTTKYGHKCIYCETLCDDLDYSNYQIKIGSTSDDLVSYSPADVHNYNRNGWKLSFDPNDNCRFVLSLSGNNSSSDVYVNSNVDTGKEYTQMYVRSDENTTIKNLTFKGGYGVLLFDGNPLTFANGKLTSEALYNTIRAGLNFVGDGSRSSAIEIENGQLIFESSSTTINIDNYVAGIKLKANITNGGFNQSAGTLNIQNVTNGILSAYNNKQLVLSGNSNITASNICVGSTDNANTLPINVNGGVHTWNGTGADGSYGIYAYGGGDVNIAHGATLNIGNVDNGIQSHNAVSSVNVLGTLNLSSIYLNGIRESNVNVGNAENSGVLSVSLDVSKTNSSKYASCIYTNGYNSINLNKGKLFVCGNGWDFSRGIRISADYSSSCLKIADDFNICMSDISRGLEVNGTWESQLAGLVPSGSLFKYAVADIAYGVSNKPAAENKDSLGKDGFYNFFLGL